MGVCSSCLGRRRSDSLDEDDESRLLFDDPNNMQYGSFADHNAGSQADPLESQREVEALQRVVARTSNNLVDVFEIAPQESQRTQPAIFSGQDARLARYQNILSNLSPDEEGEADAAEWPASDEENAEAYGQQQHPTVKQLAGEPLVGTFADAVSRAA